MRRLSRAALELLPDGIHAPRRAVRAPIGIVHFGPGAFHRAHQAAYVDAVLDHDPRWSIAAVSLRTRATIDALAQQDGLYTLAIRDAEPDLRVIGAHAAFLGPEESVETRRLLRDPAVRLVTSTVTEKGYCLATDGTLDLAHPDIVHDLRPGATPCSLVGWLVTGLAARRAADIAPFVPLPCDNLAANGTKLKAALVAFARVHDADLARWIDGEVTCPQTMVDSITPASDAELVANVSARLGVSDHVPVQREAFAQWVIEDTGTMLGPDLAAAGATLTSDVAAFERAKLRMLNGAHSTLAYLGLLRGHDSVAAAMGDDMLATFVADMLREEVEPFVGRVPGLDLADYRRAVLTRFRNPAIVHRLEQIAIDGSQKLPYRLGDSLIANRQAGRLPRRICIALAAWIALVHDRARRGIAVADPLATTLVELAAQGDATLFARTLASRGIGLPAAIVGDEAFLALLTDSVEALGHGDWSRISRHAPC